VAIITSLPNIDVAALARVPNRIDIVVLLIDLRREAADLDLRKHDQGEAGNRERSKKAGE